LIPVAVPVIVASQTQFVLQRHCVKKRVDVTKESQKRKDKKSLQTLPSIGITIAAQEEVEETRNREIREDLWDNSNRFDRGSCLARDDIGVEITISLVKLLPILFKPKDLSSTIYLEHDQEDNEDN